MAGAKGVTTFIKTELIADGYGRANVPRPGGCRNGIKVGQRVDNDIRLHVQTRRPLQELQSRKIMMALRAAGFTVCAAQVRAIDQELHLTTLVDLVATDRHGAVWAVEVKNTTLTEHSHLQSYKQQCRRTPTLRNALMHSECNVHMLQAAFGALALAKTYPELAVAPIRSLVVVGTRGRALVYRVPASYHDASLFSRGPAVPLRVAAGSAPAPVPGGTKHRRRPAGAGAGAGATRRKARAKVQPWAQFKGADEVLAAISLSREKGTRAKPGKISHVVCRHGAPVGVALCLPQRAEKCDSKLVAHALATLTVAARAARARYPSAGPMARLAVIVRSNAVVPLGRPV